MDPRKSNRSLAISIVGSYFAAGINKGWDQILDSHLLLRLCKYAKYYHLNWLSNNYPEVTADRTLHHNGFPKSNDDSCLLACLNICMADDGCRSCCTCNAIVLPSSSVSNDW